MTPEQAIVIVAQHAIADAAEDISWEDYPEIGENDWARVVDEVRSLADYPALYAQAHELLESRATRASADSSNRASDLNATALDSSSAPSDSEAR